MHALTWFVSVALLCLALAQDEQKFPVDPQTGRAIDAREISPEDLKRHIDSKTKSLIIDVRDHDAFAKQTIKGAVNIPLGQLRANLKNIPKDTFLFFT